MDQGLLVPDELVVDLVVDRVEMCIRDRQKAVVCRAKKSVANFKLREGMAIGCKVRCV